MVKPNKVFNKSLWESWALDSKELFDDLIAPCKVAIFIGESDKNCLIIDKVAESIFPSFEINGSFSMYDFDLFFTVSEDDALEILEDNSKFSEFVQSGKLGILCTVDDVAMEAKGLDKFLSTIGFRPSCSI